MNFSDRIGTFSDEDCRFIHGENIQAWKKLDFNCISCGKLCQGRSDFMKHLKIEHRQVVPICRHEIHGACCFSDPKYKI